MKKLIVGIWVSLGLSASVLAEGDAAMGKQKSAACVACHGEGGNSAIPSFPKLAGQHANYLLKQLKNIQCGDLSEEDQKAKKCTPRSVPTMAGQLNGMNEKDFADIAAYYSSQTMSGAQADPELIAKGEEIYRAGIRSKGVAACTACHSPLGKGNGPAGFPALGGQHADYISAQLKSFRAAADGDSMGRANDGETRMMRDVSLRLSDSEIEAVSSYISGLH